jgi:GDP-L-fucose synthase
MPHFAMNTDSSIFVAGHRGMVGSAICRSLQAHGYHNIRTRTRAELDLMDAVAVDAYLAESRPDAVVVAAARVGGIHANNTYPAEFIHENIAIAHNLIHGSHKQGVGRLLFLGSSCIYPRDAPQPMPESCLMTGPLERTNEAYAIAKIAGLKLCEFYRRQYGVVFHSAMPTNLYGPGDNYHPENSHVLPALIRRIHEAKEEGKPGVVLWGTGTPLREFLHADDCADAMIHLLQLENPPDLVNVGSGQEISIRKLAELIARIVGYTGTLTQDTTKPDGTPRKLMDNSLITALGWNPRYDLETGIRHAYNDFLRSRESASFRQN